MEETIEELLNGNQEENIFNNNELNNDNLKNDFLDKAALDNNIVEDKFKNNFYPNFNEIKNKEENDIIYNEKELKKFQNYFPKIKIGFHEELFQKNDINYNLDKTNFFFCGLKNENTGLICEKGNEICPSCMKKNQKLYGLKNHYLINSAGRVCTYRKNKLYCQCKFSRIEEKFGFEYSIIYICGQKQQCEPCKNLTKYINRYFSQKLMNNLKKRDTIIV